MIRIVGPKASRNVSSGLRPVSGGSALSTTPLLCRSFVSSSVLTNVGTCVLKWSTSLVSFAPCGLYGVFSLRVPSIVSPLEEISLTLPCSTCWRKNGLYGTCVEPRAGR